MPTNSPTTTANPVGQTGSGTTQPAGQTGATATTTPEPHPLAEAGQQATQSAGQLAGRAADLGIQQADRGRTLAADGIDQVAATIRRVSTDIKSDQPGIADATTTAADQAERIASYLRQNDARQIISNIEGVARRQPLIFLGGAFLLGAAASRFLKAAGGSSNASGGGARAGTQAGASSTYRSVDSYQPTGPGASGGNERF